jgi:PIN domain nuclease of toxin-antitoxin system
MKYLLDTHTILWFFDNTEKLTKKAFDVILDLDSKKYVSIVSAWEVAIKISLGKLKFDGGVANFFSKIEENGFKLFSIAEEQIKQVEQLPLLHRDPFDRLLIASAITEEMTFVTGDINIQQYNISWIW